MLTTMSAIGRSRSLRTLRVAIAAAAFSLHATGAAGQLAVSANDGKQPRLGETPADVKPDTVAVIDLNHYPPRVLGAVPVPVSMIGPPTSVAVARDGRLAIVTAAQKFDPHDRTRFVLDDTVSVIDLADPTHPVVLQTLRAGAGASGVSINRAGTLALVASTGDGTVTIFSITGKTLSRVGQVHLDAEPGPVDVAISPDGKTALVTQRRGNGIWRLAINGTTVTNTGITVATGGQPYGSVFSRNGRFAYNTNLLGRLVPDGAAGAHVSGPRIGTITAIDLESNTVATTTEVGSTPEHVTLSPDGKYLQVTLINGSTASVTSANHHAFGLLKVYRVEGAELTLVAETKTGAWGQGATWSKDGRVILLQAADAREIEVYRFDGKTLKRDMAATLRFETRPGAITTALGR